MNILVICTGNSARSILLEALLRAGGFNAHSAASNPTGRVHPVALSTLAKHGVPAPSPRSKSWDEFATDGAPRMDLIVTVCASAAGETCPVWPAKDGVAPIRAHWGVDDPAAAAPEVQEAAFEDAFQRLRRKARAFAALESIDPEALARIGALE